MTTVQCKDQPQEANVIPHKVVAVLDSMWDWRQMTSGAGYVEAPRHFRINPDNHSGRRLYRLVGPGSNLLVTNSCRELCGSARQHGTPDPEWLAENLRLLEPFDVLLVCGKVAQATYKRSGYAPTSRVIEIDHPAARRWTIARLNEVAAQVQAATYCCAECGGTYELGWSAAEAEAELSQNFPGMPKADCAIVCDDCYQKIMGRVDGS